MTNKKGYRMNPVIPKWITIVSTLITLLGIFVGFSLYISPETFVPNVDFSALGARYLTQMWAARQIAIAAIIGYGVLQRSAAMLKIALIAYSLMTFQDIFIGVSLSDSGLIFGSSFFCSLAIIMLFVLSGKKE
jgi:ribulose kinase